MTRADYELVARIIKTFKTREMQYLAATVFCIEFSKNSMAFRPDLFMAACGFPSDGEKP